MRYFDTPSKTSMVFATFIVIVFALLITYDNHGFPHLKTFILAGFACYIVHLWFSYYWEKTWSQEWKNLDKELEEIREQLDELEEILRSM